MERWDAYDADFHRVEGKSLVRGEPIPDGLYHIVCDVLVRHTDGSYLLMLRDPRKHSGGMWEASAGGSALQGEAPMACAVRELREETGLCGRMTEVGRTASARNHTLYVCYLCETDGDKDAVTLQDGETADYRWVSRDALANMPKSELVTHRIQNFIDELRRPDAGHAE